MNRETDRSDSALRALHEAHAPALLRYVVSLTGDEAFAQDVVQETLVRAWRHPEIMDRDEGPRRAWLFTVARNLVIDDRRSARNNRERSTDHLPERSTGDETMAVLDSWLITEALLGLSPDHRAVVVGAYFGGRSVADLAAELEVPPGTVKSRMHYAMRALRLALQEKGVTQ
ncbi:sigma-70 family RNA polymerase sigma factor [Occultella glacieicola]|uniref:RNA polymerase sigma factor n=1 Tax=Occultella glacieicola TaxID=2518684 RepID=A0ABY2E782_9MICO|nr:sigma-70 family RNA polymerase sigma factor [Occultella glacieicola]TDE97417.1 sigma-70 family RNA polymerase sigma factor [Occultella glacieicola]